MDPARGGPLKSSPTLVTIVAHSSAEADAWATALMVRGSLEGADLARRNNLDVLFIDRDENRFCETRVGRLFEARSDPARVA
jgi:thiamine biosynthesis lipoprotein